MGPICPFIVKKIKNFNLKSKKSAKNGFLARGLLFYSYGEGEIAVNC